MSASKLDDSFSLLNKKIREPYDAFAPRFPHLFILLLYYVTDYIMPIPGLAGIAGTSSFMLATTDSVVSNVLATLLAF